MISRTCLPEIKDRLAYFPVVALLGPRQCGKTTLARLLLGQTEQTVYLDLEKPSDLARLDDPEFFLRAQQGKLVCLDEIQRKPELFPLLRSLVDEHGTAGQFLLLGSASPALLRQSSESLAGRISYFPLTPLLLEEVGAKHQTDLWFRGGFPRSFLAPSDRMSWTWRQDFITTFLERDLPQLGIRVESSVLRRFWSMCAHLHGDLWNASKIGASLGVTAKTVGHYLDILTQSFVLRRLDPYAVNMKKRLVKSPKVYLRDSGLLHALLGVSGRDEWMGHPGFGSSWEGYVIEQVLAALPDWQPSFYRTAAGAEMDLVMTKGQRMLAFECKASAAPKPQRGFWHALEDLQPDAAYLVAPVPEAYPLAPKVSVIPPSQLPTLTPDSMTPGLRVPSPQ